MKIYGGDAYRGTYRTTQSILVLPTGQSTGTSTSFFAGTGPTRNYGIGSPVNGSTLSSTPTTSDIFNGPYSGADEDGVPNDCLLWNAKGHADTSAMLGHSVTFVSSTSSVNLYGFGANPLEQFEPPGLGVSWNMTVNIDSSKKTAFVNYTHTCYPAHIVKVNGTVVYSYIPGPDNTFYIAGAWRQAAPLDSLGRPQL
jgi:hypothetical protein